MSERELTRVRKKIARLNQQVATLRAEADHIVLKSHLIIVQSMERLRIGNFDYYSSRWEAEVDQHSHPQI
jgi:hypothetical protein